MWQVPTLKAVKAKVGTKKQKGKGAVSAAAIAALQFLAPYCNLDQACCSGHCCSLLALQASFESKSIQLSHLSRCMVDLLLIFASAAAADGHCYMPCSAVRYARIVFRGCHLQ